MIKKLICLIKGHNLNSNTPLYIDAFNNNRKVLIKIMEHPCTRCNKLFSRPVMGYERQSIANGALLMMSYTDYFGEYR